MGPVDPFAMGAQAAEVLSSEDVTSIEDETALTTASDLHKDEAEAVLSIVEKRESVRGSRDAIVVLEAWAYEPWSDYDIATNKVVLAGSIEDYSDKAFKVQSAAEVQMDVVDSKSPEEVRDTAVSSLVKTVDETEEDFHDERGEAFLPKSAVAGVYSYDA